MTGHRHTAAPAWEPGAPATPIAGAQRRPDRWSERHELFEQRVGRRSPARHDPAELGPGGPDATRTLLDAAGAVTIPVDDRQAQLAVDVWLRYGKGNHPAGLNYGDCFSYALAAHLDVPLLCIGADFAQTDLAIVDVGI